MFTNVFFAERLSFKYLNHRFPLLEAIVPLRQFFKLIYTIGPVTCGGYRSLALCTLNNI